MMLHVVVIALCRGFNLTRVECKSQTYIFSLFETQVLILPEWNVNIVNNVTTYNAYLVLILPEWNVNCMPRGLFVLLAFVLILPEWNVNSYTGFLNAVQLGFNLTRVECKSELYMSVLFAYVCFNLTRVECKFGHKGFYPLQSVCFNLTRVECKCRKTVCHRSEPRRFNLTRVECKSENLCKSLYLFFVLILPEWNVNGYYSGQSCTSCRSFNLTRVECKY